MNSVNMQEREFNPRKRIALRAAALALGACAVMPGVAFADGVSTPVAPADDASVTPIVMQADSQATKKADAAVATSKADAKPATKAQDAAVVSGTASAKNDAAKSAKSAPAATEGAVGTKADAKLATASQGEYVAMIGDAGYESLDLAIDDANKLDELTTIKLLDDAAITGGRNINKAIEIIGDGKHVIDVYKDVVDAGSKAHFNINDSFVLRNVILNCLFESPGFPQSSIVLGGNGTIELYGGSKMTVRESGISLQTEKNSIIVDASELDVESKQYAAITSEDGGNPPTVTVENGGYIRASAPVKGSGYSAFINVIIDAQGAPSINPEYSVKIEHCDKYGINNSSLKVSGGAKVLIDDVYAKDGIKVYPGKSVSVTGEGSELVIRGCKMAGISNMQGSVDSVGGKLVVGDGGKLVIEGNGQGIQNASYAMIDIVDGKAIITGNGAKASHGGGVENHGKAILTGADIYDNRAAYAGDDVYNFAGATIALAGFEGKKCVFGPCGALVDGWYVDGYFVDDSTPRWNGTYVTEDGIVKCMDDRDIFVVSIDELLAAGLTEAFGIKAAHGEESDHFVPEDEPEQPAEDPDGPTEDPEDPTEDPEDPTEGTDKTEPVEDSEDPEEDPENDMDPVEDPEEDPEFEEDPWEDDGEETDEDPEEDLEFDIDDLFPSGIPNEVDDGFNTTTSFTPGTLTPAVATIPDAPTPLVAVPGAAPVALAAPAPAPVAVGIPDVATPLAPVEALADDETPLAHHVACWPHTVMMLGILVTLLYGAATFFRRKKHMSVISGYDSSVSGR